MGQTHCWDLNPLHHCMCIVVLVNNTASYKIFSWVEESLAYIKRDSHYVVDPTYQLVVVVDLDNR